MHVNLVTFGAGVWMIGTGIDGVVPTMSASGVLKVIGGVILIVASILGA
jgi:hypothetical protein